MAGCVLRRFERRADCGRAAGPDHSGGRSRRFLAAVGISPGPLRGDGWERIGARRRAAGPDEHGAHEGRGLGRRHTCSGSRPRRRTGQHLWQAFRFRFSREPPGWRSFPCPGAGRLAGRGRRRVARAGRGCAGSPRGTDIGNEELATTLTMFVLAEAMRSATGACADTFRAESAVRPHEAETVSGRLLRAAALLRVCLVSGDPGAGEALSRLNDSLHGMPALRATLSIVAEACARGQLTAQALAPASETPGDILYPDADVSSVSALARGSLAERAPSTSRVPTRSCAHGGPRMVSSGPCCSPWRGTTGPDWTPYVRN